MNDDIQSNLTLRYMIAAIALSTVTIGAIVVVTAVRPEHDNSGIITTICAVGAATYPGLMTFIRGQANSEEVKRVKEDNDAKAEEVRRALLESQRKLTEATNAQREHLEDQDRMLREQSQAIKVVSKQTDGLLSDIKQSAFKEGQQVGEKVALEKLGMPDKRGQ